MRKFEGYVKGVDFGGWLSQCSEYTDEHYKTFITREDFKIAASWGIDHIRLPVDYMVFQNDDGSFIEERFNYIQNAIDWAKENNLKLILDLHKTCGYSFDVETSNFFTDESLHEHFYSIWDQFANRFAKYEDMIAFELLNEVTSPSYSDAWNKIIYKVIQRIRKVSPTIKILVGGYWNNSIDALKDLDKPFDENIVYNFHCYEPFLFTHQRANWIKNMPDDLKLNYPLTYEEYNATCVETKFTDFVAYPPANKLKFDKEYFKNRFGIGLKICEERNVSLYCGEYGVIDHADPKCALEWYKDIHAAFEELEMGRACWTYKSMSFGLTDEHMKPVFEEIIKYL